MSAVHVVTGAAGHLGTAVVRALLDDGRTVRALALPGQELLAASLIDDAARARLSRRDADVTDRASLDAALADLVGEDLVVIHTAGLISIGHLPVARLRQVNVRGAAAVLAAGARRLVHVSSVHAVPEPSDPTEVIREVDDPDAYDPRAVRGGYDVVDVRDVADAVVAAADGGEAGRTYLLSGRWAEVREILAEVRALRGGRAPLVLPTGLARGVLPAVRALSGLTGSRPLFTGYALDTLSAPALFSQERAAAELGSSPRPLADSVHDTVDGLERR